MFPVSPLEHGREGGSDDSEHSADLGHKLEDCAEQCPQRGPGHENDLKPDQPEKTYSQRILELSDEPVLQRAAGYAKVLSEIHFHEMLLFKV
jgi:hypothetical protein